MAEITVVLKWKRLRKLQDFRKLKDEDLGSSICMITGYHPVFGNNSLLYVGSEVGNLFGPPIYMEVRGGRFNDPPNGIHAYVSQVESIDDDSDYSNALWESVKGKLEGLLSFYHIPPFNNKWNLVFPEQIFFEDSEDDLRIINTGDRGNLCPELSHYGQRLALNIGETNGGEK